AAGPDRRGRAPRIAPSGSRVAFFEVTASHPLSRARAIPSRRGRALCSTPPPRCRAGGRRAGCAAMKPLAALTPALCRSLGGAACDSDDALTDHGRLTGTAYDALWRLARAGLELVAVTGRPLGWCDVIARQWPVVGAVGENGGGWV